MHSVPLLLLSGCGQPKYWIKGLTLPPGSVEVERLVTASQLNENPEAPLSGVTSKATQKLKVEFNSKLDWDAVVAHFDRELAAAGYQEVTQAKYSGSDQLLKKIASGRRLYKHANGKLSLSLRDNRSVRVANESAAAGAISDPAGESLIYVYRR